MDKEKAALNGISAAQVAGALEHGSLTGKQTGLLHQPLEKEDVPIVLRLPLADRAGIERLETSQDYCGAWQPGAAYRNW